MVRGADDNMPLIGATVRVQSGAVTVTDADGAFSVNVRKGQTVTFSYIGYTTQSIKISDRSKVEIYLKEDSKTLDEVVVVGYGTMKRSDLTGSVVSVSAEDIKKTVATSLDQALQGRAAGVQVTQNSGAPGGGISVSIRGTNSLNGNEPLYVIDGVPLSGQADGNSNALSAINPSDIVSMEVLKDASATAIYGSRASNGVIMITTRRGEAGKTKLSYEGYYGIQNIPDRLDVMDLRQFATYRNLRAEVMGFGATEEFADVSILGKGTDW
ncbi:TonB-dependent receptor plug domain-containing protein, partial [Duncaniella muris]|uniref:TonB-dependent receptor plug domain-containing protein n=1 Tax=Duncaniella muris TaxID=2094150 RepID=UPI0025B38C6F